MAMLNHLVANEKYSDVLVNQLQPPTHDMVPKVIKVPSSAHLSWSLIIPPTRRFTSGLG